MNESTLTSQMIFLLRHGLFRKIFYCKQFFRAYVGFNSRWSISKVWEYALSALAFECEYARKNVTMGATLVRIVEIPILPILMTSIIRAPPAVIIILFSRAPASAWMARNPVAGIIIIITLFLSSSRAHTDCASELWYLISQIFYLETRITQNAKR